MTTEEQELGLQGVALVGVVAHRMLKEKDEAIERLERTVDLLTARVEELSNGVQREAA